MKALRIAAFVLVAIACGAGLVYAWPWSTDMYNTIVNRPGRTVPESSPPGTVAVDSKDPDPTDPLKVWDEFELLYPENPIPTTAESIEEGKKLFGIFCVPCHGETGKSDGPISALLMIPPPKLVDIVYQRTDGRLFATIRNGGPARIMPPYGARTTFEERWHIVNFLRTLEKNGKQ